MNENINLYEILKDCPNGTPLYCSIFGDVKFAEICNTDPYGVAVTLNNGGCVSFSKDGLFSSIFPDAECVLFPSKEQRDWSKFKPKGNALSVEDVFNNAVDATIRANRAKKEKNERLDEECMAFTSEQADRFINEFSFLGRYGFTFRKCLTRENNYYYNYGRMAYSVMILDKRENVFETIHFVKGDKFEMIFCSIRTNGYCRCSFKEFAEKLAGWFNFS